MLTTAKRGNSACRFSLPASERTETRIIDDDNDDGDDADDDDDVDDDEDEDDDDDDDSDVGMFLHRCRCTGSGCGMMMMMVMMMNMNLRGVPAAVQISVVRPSVTTSSASCKWSDRLCSEIQTKLVEDRDNA